MKFKAGVKIYGARPELLAGLQVADSLWVSLGLTLTVTSICDGEHSRSSLHWNGLAADLRTRDLPPEHPPAEMVADLREWLTDEWDVLDESEVKLHIHMEFQPKR